MSDIKVGDRFEDKWTRRVFTVVRETPHYELSSPGTENIFRSGDMLMNPLGWRRLPPETAQGPTTEGTVAAMKKAWVGVDFGGESKTVAHVYSMNAKGEAVFRGEAKPLPRVVTDPSELRPGLQAWVDALGPSTVTVEKLEPPPAPAPRAHRFDDPYLRYSRIGVRHCSVCGHGEDSRSQPCDPARLEGKSVRAYLDKLHAEMMAGMCTPEAPRQPPPEPYDGARTGVSGLVCPHVRRWR